MGALAFPCFSTLVSFNILIIMIKTTDGKQKLVRKPMLLHFVALFKCDFGMILSLIKSDTYFILSFEVPVYAVWGT